MTSARVAGRLHGSYVYGRRVRALAEAIAPLLPPNARVLDVGCGDGLVDALILERRPDVSIEGIDVLVRPDTRIPVRRYDGRTFPYEDGGFDAVTFVDVLHHADRPEELLAEAKRVARQVVVLKDHLLEGIAAYPTLRFMDWVGNARHGVRLPYHYWRRDQWMGAIEALGLTVQEWTGGVPLYPWWASWVFGRSLHFVAKLGI